MSQYPWTGAARRVSLFVVTFILTLASLTVATASQAANVVGSLPGSFGVSATGAATYSIPIAVPRGSGGLTPSIALVYNSQSGDGAAGYGWTLSGLSAITRCNKTIHDDGSTEGVSLTSSDDYCLDGQRLILKTDGTYDTEIESFSRITATSGTNGPASFTVQTKDGGTWEYGNTTDSRILATGTSTARVWALDKVTDANGNYYTVTYQNNDTTTGDYWPTKIDYTGNTNAGTSPLHEIQLDWTPRSAASVQARYLQGSLITQTQRLSDIEVKYSGNATFTYTLNYQTDSATQRNQLTSVQECAAGGNCYAATNIAWQNGAVGWRAPASVPGIAVNADQAESAHLVDVNGDGIADLLYPGSSEWMVLFGQPGGGFGASPTPVPTGIPLTNDQWALVGGINGSGKLDVLVPTTSNGWKVWEATGSETNSVFTSISVTGLGSLGYGTNSQTNTPDYEGNVVLADSKGQGLPDFIYSDGTSIYRAPNNNGAGFGASVSIGLLTGTVLSSDLVAHNREFIDTPMDFDGFGRAGRLGLNITTYTTECNPQDQPGCVSTSTTKYAWWGLESTDTGYSAAESVVCWAPTMTPIPFNSIGGATDLLYSCDSTGVYDVELSTAKGFVDVPTGINYSYSEDPVVVDYYGDGRQEAIIPDANSSTGWTMIRVNYDPSLPAFKSAVTSGVAAPYPSSYLQGSLRIGAIESNGLDDLLYAVASGSTYVWKYALHAGGAADLVKSITDGMGNTFVPHYTSLAAQDGVYSKDTGATYPVQDTSVPLQVVSSYDASNGIGGTYTKKFTYSGGKLSSDGQGFLGFSTRTIEDNRNNITTTENYRQDWPLVGALDSETVKQSNGDYKISLVTNTYGSTPASCTADSLCFTYLEDRTVTHYDANGSALKTVDTQNTAHDSYGNVTTQVVTTTNETASPAGGNTFKTTITSEYDDNTSASNYCADVPTSVIVAKKVDSGSEMSRTTSATLDTMHCAPASVTVDSGLTPNLETDYVYDAWGNPKTVTVSGTDVASRTTTTDYSTYHGEYPNKITNVLGQSTTLTWNPDLGLKHTATDPNGHTTTWQYDSFGRVSKVIKPDQSSTSWSYAWVGCPPNSGQDCYSIGASASNGSQTIPLGATVFDSMGRVVRQQKTLLGGVRSSVDTVYNALGEVTSVTKPFLSSQSQHFVTTYSSYDVLGRPTEIKQPSDANDTSSVNDDTTINYSGFTVTTTLNAPGDVSSETSTKTVDVIGEVVSTTDSNGTTTAYTYDAFGDLVKTEVGGQTTTMTYDGLGHKLTMTDPDMGHWTYTPDALGELLTQVDAKSQTINQHYDLLGRITSRKEFDASSTQKVADTWCYDGPVNPATPGTCATSNAAPYIGLPASLSDSNGFSKQYGYDSLSRPDDLTTTISGGSYDVSTTYDSFGRVQTVSYPESVTPVTSPTPTAAASVSPSTIVLGEGVTLDGSGSTDPNGLPLQYDWSQTSGPGVTTFADTDADATSTNGTFSLPGNYTLQLIVRDAGGASVPVSVSVAVRPTMPTTVSATHTDNGTYTGNVTVNWPKVLGADSYKVFVSTTDTGPYSELGETQGNLSTSYSVTGLTDGTYYYKVEACVVGLCSDQQATPANIDVEVPPDAPSSLSAPSSATSTSAPVTYQVSWGASSVTGGRAPAYVVQEMDTVGTNETTFTTVYTSCDSVTLCTENDPTSFPATKDQDGIYVYRVKACNPADMINLCSAYTTETGHTAVTNPPTVPGTPQIPSSDEHSSGWYITWVESTPSNAVWDSAVTYYLYQSFNGGDWTLVYSGSGNPNGGNTLWANAGGTTNGTYAYKIKACTTDYATGGTACTDPDARVSAGYATVIAPPAPTGISVPTQSAWNGSFKISFSENAGGISVTRYAVRLGTYETETGTYIWHGGSDACGSSTTSCTYSANKVTAGTYHVEVEACYGSVCSDWTIASGTVRVWYLAKPAAPSLSGPSITMNGSIGLQWSVPSTTTSFKLYGAYQTKTTGNWTSATVIYSGSATGYTDTIALTKAGASYYVESCNQAGCSGASNKINVTYSVTGGGGGGGCGASCGGCGKVACFVMPDPDQVAWIRHDLEPVSLIPAIDKTRIVPLPDLMLTRPIPQTQLALNAFVRPPAVPERYVGQVAGYRVTTFASLPALPLPHLQAITLMANRALLALQQTRQRLLGHTLQQPSEAAMQVAANRRAEARFASLTPSVSANERAAWAEWQSAQERANPNGPRYAPPAYLAYADARIEPVTSTPYRFTVQYVYDDTSGGLEAVANADTGFIYWQADTDDGIAPVDAWGHLLAFSDGNGVSTVSSYDAATGAPTGISSGIDQATNVQNLVYTWDGYGNLAQRQDANQTLSETIHYDSLNRLMSSTVTNPAGTGPTLSLSYDDIGNITCKSDVVGHACSPGSTDYTYDPNHPHAVQSIAGLPGTYQYDADGNMTSGNSRTLSWSVDNLPTQITGPNGSSSFAYGPDHQRYQQTQADGTVTTYIGGLYEVVSNGTSIQYRHNIVAGGQVIAVHTLDQSGNATTSYLHYDHLGSVDAITDDTGAVVQRMSFDAFGQRRDPANWTNDLTPTDIAGLKSTTDRGFTDQEQLDNVGLVHMNGRVYDPQIGRFISADPTVPDPMY
ncbi:MAG: SpvB/TcaC N-terminal domain-containing protein, partial [Gammaproteobacteria bacterium]